MTLYASWGERGVVRLQKNHTHNVISNMPLPLQLLRIVPLIRKQRAHVEHYFYAPPVRIHRIKPWKENNVNNIIFLFIKDLNHLGFWYFVVFTKILHPFSSFTCLFYFYWLSVCNLRWKAESSEAPDENSGIAKKDTSQYHEVEDNIEYQQSLSLKNWFLKTFLQNFVPVFRYSWSVRYRCWKKEILINAPLLPTVKL